MVKFTLAQHFEGKAPVVEAIYQKVWQAVSQFGPVQVEPKKTSIHLVHRSAFAGVATQRSALLLNLKSTSPIQHARIKKTEKVSANRFHQEVKLNTPEEVDATLIGWLPPTCGYRRVEEGKDLLWWHPLISGSPDTVHQAGISVKKLARTEVGIKPGWIPHYIIDDFVDDAPAVAPEPRKKRAGSKR